MKILLLGATGLLGSTLSQFLMFRGYDIETHGHSNEAAQHHADIIDSREANILLSRIQADIIINLVGLTNIDICEKQPKQAYLANVKSVENITNWIKQENSACHLVHISTDHVYDSPILHTEENIMLSNYYSFSKYAGELIAATVKSSILRTNFFGRSLNPKRESLTDWIYRTLSENNPIQVFDDILFSPLSISTLSEMIDLVIKNKPIGVFNLGSHDGMSKADFAFSFANELALPSKFMKRTTTDRVTFLKTYRAKDMRMNSTKFENALRINLPQLNDEIKKVAGEYDEIA